MKIIFSALFLVLAAQLVVSNVLAGRGGELVALEEQATQLARENEELRTQIVQQSSLQKISFAAEEAGFVKPESIVYIKLSEPVALGPSR